MQAALENFALVKDTHKLIILGDMFELGTETTKEHQYIADLAKSLHLSNTILVGKNFFTVKTNYKKFETFEALKIFLENQTIQNQTILIKGSRGMALERVLEVI